jgi:tRNA(Arg) A34 adenosine deaminase TadA
MTFSSPAPSNWPARAANAATAARSAPSSCIDGKIIGEGWNRVVASKDPTAHAEIAAIRMACAALGHFHLRDCTLYASSEPCPMCLSAAYWARIGRIVFANSRAEAAAIGFLRRCPVSR